MPIECIVRGYITGSGWASYQKTGKVCGKMCIRDRVDVMEDGLVRQIAEIDVGEGDVALQFVVGGGAVVVGVLPRPDTGAFAGLHEGVVLIIPVSYTHLATT